MSKQSEVCGTQEAAKLLGVSLRTIQLWVEGGVLPAWKTAGGHRRIPRHAVNQLLHEREQALDPGSVSEAPQPVGNAVVVVEDDPDLLRLYQLQMSTWDFPLTLHTAQNGFQGLVQVGEHKPTVLITDLNMPGMDGFQMIRNLKAIPQFSDLKIIAVSALTKADVAHHGGLPADVTLIQKPVPFARLEELVRGRLLAQPQAADKVSA